MECRTSESGEQFDVTPDHGRLPLRVGSGRGRLPGLGCGQHQRHGSASTGTDDQVSRHPQPKHHQQIRNLHSATYASRARWVETLSVGKRSARTVNASRGQPIRLRRHLPTRTIRRVRKGSVVAPNLTFHSKTCVSAMAGGNQMRALVDFDNWAGMS